MKLQEIIERVLVDGKETGAKAEEFLNCAWTFKFS